MFPKCRCKARDGITLQQLQTAHPDAFYIVAGDFNKADLKSVLPHFYQHVTCAIRWIKYSGSLNTNVKNAYTVAPLPQIGNSDHLTILLEAKIETRATSSQGLCCHSRCFHHYRAALRVHYGAYSRRQQHLGTEEDLEECTEILLGFISKCIDDVIVTKTVKLRLTDKSWLTSKVRFLLRLCDAAFRSGDTEVNNVARSSRKRGIRELSSNFTDSEDTRHLWVL